MAAEIVDPKTKQQSRQAICESYPSHMLLKLEELRQQEALCDVTINIGGQSYHAHRAVLAASSGYFMAMFSRGFVESHQNEVDIQGDAASFKCLLQFAYTGKLPINETNAYDVIVMANYLQFTLGCDTALNFVRRYIRMSPEDAFKISVLDFVKPQMVKRFQYYLLGEMKDVMQSQIFLEQASDLYMAELLAEKELAEADDDEVVQAVVAWLLYDWETRQKHAFNLMSKIDFDKVTKEVLEQIVDGDILESIDCKELHDKATSLLPELKTKTDKKEKSTMITAPLGVSNEGETKHMEYLTHDRCGNSMIPVWKTIRPFTATYPSFIHYTPETVEGLDVDPNPYPEGLLCYNWFRLIAGDGILYAQVSYHPQFFGSLVKILYRYNFKENTFEQVFRPHASFTEKYETIYMDKCFYFVDTAKGIINSYDTTTEILKLDHKPMLQPFWSGYEDDEIRYVSSYMGRVLVYGPLEADGNCFLQAYDPAQDLWCMVMEDILPLQVYPYEVAGSLEPIIMQHNGTCYRIAFYSNCNPTQGREQYQLPIVHELNFKSVDGILSAKVGEEIEQSNLPIKTFGAFQIDDDLFVYGKGDNVYKTGQKAWNGPWDESKLEVFDTGFPSSFLCNYVRFTFDSLQLANDDSDSDN